VISTRRWRTVRVPVARDVRQLVVQPAHAHLPAPLRPAPHVQPPPWPRPPHGIAGTITRLSRLHVSYLQRAPRIIAGLATVMGLLTLVDVLVPDERGHVHAITGLLPVPATSAATAVTAVAGFLLLRVAAGLRMRKRIAWRGAVAITAVLAVAHILKGHKIGEAAIALALLALLLTARSRFTAKPDPVSRWFAVRLLFELVTVAMLYGMATLYLYPHRVVGDPSWWARLREVAYALVGADGPVTVRGERFGDVLHATLLAFGLVTVVVVVLVALRPSEPIARLSQDDEQRLRSLLARHGKRDSLGYFALRRDKTLAWSPSGKSAIAYRVVHGVALASGDPIGDPEAWPGAMTSYRRLVEDYGWTAAVIGCSELGATVFKRECDLAAIELGDEAVVDVDSFTLDGRQMRGVRQACTRVERCGYSVRIRRTKDIDRDEFADVLRVASMWRGAAVERGYSMALSRLGDAADEDCVVVTAYQDGELRGVLHFVPWGCDGLSLDLMRRDRSADNGLNELMIVELIKAGPGLGVRRVSLNFALFRDVLERGQKVGAGPILRAWRGLLLFASRWWQIESLYRFNLKFRPEWEPRFLSYPATRDLPRIAIAALEAEAFLIRPRLLKQICHRT
jgi:lysyl-tRNA synthetase class 2